MAAERVSHRPANIRTESAVTISNARILRPTVRFFLCFAVVLSLAVMYAWPKLVSLEYHLRYGDRVFIKGVSILVPKDFFVLSQDQPQDHLIVSLSCSSVGIPFRHRPSASITVYQSQSDLPFQPSQAERLMDATIGAAEDEGFALKATRKLSIANRTGYCLQFTSDRQQEVLQRCFIEGSTVVLYFRGSQKYLGDFDSVLKGMVVN
jgi:hypothetical protein